MSFLKLFTLALGFLDKLLGGLGDRRKEQNGANRNRVEQARYDQKQTAAAMDARRAAERRFDAGGMPDDDPNRRD